MFSAIETPHLVALALCAGAAVSDAKTGHIPNWLTLPAIALAPVTYLIFGGPAALAASILGLFLSGLGPYILFRTGGAGGGDVKLLAGVGAISGAGFGIETMLFGSVVAVMFALASLTYRGQLLATLANCVFVLVNPLLPKSRRRSISHTTMSTLRMGVPFFVGAILAVWIRSI